MFGLNVEIFRKFGLEPNDSILQALSQSMPEDYDSLYFYVRTFFDVRLPTEAVCNGHRAPFDFLAALYFRRDRDGTPTPTVLGIGPRGGRKTLAMTVSEVLDALRGLDVVHVASIEAQATRGKRYADDLIRLDYVSDRILHAHQRRFATINGGSYECIWATPNMLNGPHSSTLRIDELDLLERHLLDQAYGIATSKRPDVPISISYITSLKSASGLAAEMLAKPSVTKFIWCYKEVTERCPDSRSGVEPRIAYIDRETYDARDEQGYRDLPLDMRSHYKPFRVYNNCFSCPIIGTCAGDLKRASGEDKIDDVITTFLNADPRWWMLEKESRIGKVEGRCFPSYNPQTHVEMFRFTPSPKWETYVFFDPGFHRPFIGIAQYDPEADCIHVFEDIHQYGQNMNITIDDLIARLNRVLASYNLKRDTLNYVVDIESTQVNDEGKTLIRKLKEKFGWKNVFAYSSPVVSRIQEINARLKVINGKPRLKLYIYNEQRNGAVNLHQCLLYAMFDKTRNGVWTDKYAKQTPWEHGLDALGYLVEALNRRKFKREEFV